MRLIYISFIVLILISCKNVIIRDEIKITTPDENYVINNYENIKNKIIDEEITSMSLEAKIAQMLLVSIESRCTDQIIKLQNAEYSPGGFLLFRYNVNTDRYQKLNDYINEIKNNYTSKNMISPYISIDHEGGTVNRLISILPELKSQEDIANSNNYEKANEIYNLQSKMLYSLGIDVNFAPVVEIESIGNKDFLQTRSFGNEEKVFNYSNIETFNVLRSGILPVLKHFPGNTNSDLHNSISIINITKDEIETEILKPYKEIRNLKYTGIMISHTILSAIDDKPSCISKKIVDMIKYEGGDEILIFTDDLIMSAMKQSGYDLKDSIIAAIDAGVDVLMLSITDYETIVNQIIENIAENTNLINKIDVAVKRILNWKIHNGLVNIKYFEDIPKIDRQVVFEYNEVEESYFNNCYNANMELIKD